MSKPDAPTPPNPVDTARASTSTNVGTAVANALMNNMNQFSPDGSLRYDQTGSFNWHDPYTNMDINLPQFTQTTTLSPQQQAIKDQSDAAKFNLAGMANSQSARIGSLLSSNIDLSGAPMAGDIQGLSQVGSPLVKSLGDVGGIQSGIGPVGAIQSSYGPQDGYSADRLRVEQGLMERLDPYLSRDKGNLEQRLADQGIGIGTEAYGNAMSDYSRQSNDARLAVIGQAGQEQSRLDALAQGQAGFYNQAQQQGYTQQMGQAGLYNDAQNQFYNQQLGQANLWNQAQGQDFSRAANIYDAQNNLRKDWLNEQYAYRNQPLNEISALMSGSQVGTPQFGATPRSQIPTTDVAGLINTNFSQQNDIYKSEMQSWNSTMGGILGGIGGIMKSDRRSKENVVEIAKLNGLNVYSYNYIGDTETRVGFMAQEVREVFPEAVLEINDVMFIDYAVLAGALHG